MFQNKELDKEEIELAGQETGGRGRLMLSLGVVMREFVMPCQILKSVVELGFPTIWLTYNTTDFRRRREFSNNIPTSDGSTRSRLQELNGMGIRPERGRRSRETSSLVGRDIRAFLG